MVANTMGFLIIKTFRLTCILSEKRPITYGVTPVTYFTLPNYNVVDMIAYNLRNSTPGYAHTETIEKYWLNDYTAIMSNIQ
jgi:hypothetical protein